MISLKYPMFLESNLTDFGLTEKEAKVYLAALELGSDSVQNIAKQANLKRPTVYLIIQELMKRGLLSEKPTHRGSIYIAENPEKILAMSQERQNALKNALPFLRAMYNVEKGKPQVRVYEGIEGMRQVYLDVMWKSKSDILFFSSIKKVNQAVPDLLDLWLKDVSGQQKSERKTKEFINPDPEDIAYGLKTEAVNKNHEVRVIPKNFPYKFVGTDNAIFEDKIMMVSFEGKLFTTVIQSEVIANTMRALFEMAWTQAVPLNKFVAENKKN